MKLVTPNEYVAQAAELVRNAKDRVYLISMVMADHPNTNELFTAIKAAAQRGVTVHVAADIFTFGEVNGGWLPFRYYSPGTKDTNRMVKVLKKAGVKFHWLGRSRVTIFNGRTHSKWCVVDDTAFVFGGVNLYDGGIDNVDYMFKVDNDPKLADRLVEEQLRIYRSERKSGNYPSIAVEQTDKKILIDGGIIGQSIIYRRACELAEEAANIVFVSQYCPTGKLARILKRKKVKLYYNKASNTQGLNKLVISFSQFVSGLNTSYRKKRYLHAKFIIFTMQDGSKRAITGSHNFAYTGVLLGTREIALETADPAIIGQLEDFITKKIA